MDIALISDLASRRLSVGIEIGIGLVTLRRELNALAILEPDAHEALSL